MTKWIKCSKLMPPDDEWIIGAYSSNGEKLVDFGVFFDGKLHCADYSIKRTLTDWMPIPEAPK